jgi:dCTP deaminase
MVLTDRDIRRLAKQNGCIVPFLECARRPGVISTGLTSAGYDVSAGRNWKVMRGRTGEVIDPKTISPRLYQDVYSEDHVIIPGNGFALAETIERFKIPEEIICIVVCKSTYARAGVCLNMTPLEPDWRGVITLEVANLAPDPVKIYVGEGIGQVLFFELTGRPEKTYAERGGRYQDQNGLTLPKVD